MNIQKIKELYAGKEFKDEKVLYLEVGYTVDDIKHHRKAIKRELERYIKWEKSNGYKIIITDVYDKPKEHKDGRGKSPESRRNNVIYQDDIAVVIEHFLSKKYKLDTSISKLAINSNIVSEDYRECKNDEDAYWDKLKNLNRTALENTMFKLHPVIRDGVYGALNLLQSQGKLIYKKVVFIEKFGEFSFITNEMEKELNIIEKKTIEELIEEHSKNYKRVTKKDIMKSSKLRNQYYKRVLKEFRNKYEDVTMLFYGVHIITTNCKAQKDIIEVNNRLIETIKNNILEKNKNQVIKVKEQYIKKNNDKKETLAFGEGYSSLPMANYEIDIIKNEKSYIEDTMRLTELFCGQIKQDINKNIENIEQKKVIDFNKYLNLKPNGVKELSVAVSNSSNSKNDNRIIDIESIGEYEPPRPMEKIRTFESVIASYSFLAKHKERRSNLQAENRSEEEPMSLSIVRSDILKETHVIQLEIDWIEMGVREGNLKDLYRQLDNLNEQYYEVNQMIIDSCRRYEEPMIL